MDLELQARTLFSKRRVPAPAKPLMFDFDVDCITGGRGRVVWGQSVFCFRGGDPQAIKYQWGTEFGPDRWIFEVKVNLDAFPREQWEEMRYQTIDGAQVDMIGPYPNEMWGMKMPLIDMTPGNEGGYLPCSEQFLQWLRLNHQAWESAPVGKFGSMDGYARMLAEMEAEQRERDEQTKKSADEFVEYIEVNRDKINAIPTRESVILTPDGKPWKMASAH